MRNYHVIIALCVVLLIVGFSTGCISKNIPVSPNTTASNATEQITLPATTAAVLTPATGPLTITESRNEASRVLALNEIMVIKLDENRGTGYSWNMSVTPGLTIVKEEFVPPVSTNGMGASGTHVWQIKANTPGAQKVFAILKRPADATTGTETSYTLFVKVP